jgi:hypothetical protein
VLFHQGFRNSASRVSKTLCHHRLISAIARNGAARNGLILFTPCRIDGP